MMLFQNLELLRIEDLACIILQSRKASSSLAHVNLSIFTKLLAKYYTYHSCMKSKNTIFITMNMTMWWAMEPWIVLIWWRFHCKGLYPSRIKQQMSSSDSCAVIPVLTIRSGVGRSSQLCFSLSFINGCALP